MVTANEQEPFARRMGCATGRVAIGITTLGSTHTGSTSPSNTVPSAVARYDGAVQSTEQESGHSAKGAANSEQLLGTAPMMSEHVGSSEVLHSATSSPGAASSCEQHVKTGGPGGGGGLWSEQTQSSSKDAGPGQLFPPDGQNVVLHSEGVRHCPRTPPVSQHMISHEEAQSSEPTGAGKGLVETTPGAHGYISGSTLLQVPASTMSVALPSIVTQHS